MTERFNKAYDALVKAYFEGTLAAGTCSACAVGNIVAAGQGGTVEKFINYDHAPVYVCDSDNHFWSCFLLQAPDKYQDLYLKSITDYSWDELAEIESAFEHHTKIKYFFYHEHDEQKVLEDQFNGLCAVVDVMCKLDGIDSPMEYKDKFREHPQLA